MRVIKQETAKHKAKLKHDADVCRHACNVNHPVSRTFSYGTYALYREKALHESCQVLVEHAQGVAKIWFGTQANRFLF